MRFIYVLIVVFISFSYSSYSNENYIVNSETDVFVAKRDSLFISRITLKNDTLVFIVEKGTELKIWINDQKISGYFLFVNDGFITIETDSIERKLELSEISKIRINKSSSSLVIGFMVIVGGAGASVFGISMATLGVLAYPILIPIGLGVMAGGGGLILVGKRIRGISYNTHYGWIFQ